MLVLGSLYSVVPYSYQLNKIGMSSFSFSALHWLCLFSAVQVRNVTALANISAGSSFVLSPLLSADM